MRIGEKRRPQTTNRVRRNKQNQSKRDRQEVREIRTRDHTRNDHGVEKHEKVGRTQTLGQDRLITRPHKQVRELRDQDRSEKVDAATRDMKNRTAPGIDHIHIEITLKAGEANISKTLAKLYTKCLSE